MSVPKSLMTDSQRECSRRSFLATTSQTAGAALLIGSAKSACGARTAQEARGQLFFESATTLAAMIRTKQVSSAEVMQSFLDRIAVVDPKIKAVLYLNGKRALMRAREADVALAKGTIWGPLHGVPVSIKDNLDTVGIPTTCGVPLWRNRIATEDATVVRKVKVAGAIVLAKTNLPFCGGAYESQNLFCTTSNPYDSERTPGGSSGGEAALIASGGSPMGIGADTGGSIRVPSHFCGIAGLRPSHGRVSLTGFLPEQDGPGPVWYTTAGPMARYAEHAVLCVSNYTPRPAGWSDLFRERGLTG
jgi:amidase